MDDGGIEHHHKHAVPLLRRHANRSESHTAISLIGIAHIAVGCAALTYTIDKGAAAQDTEAASGGTGGIVSRG